MTSGSPRVTRGTSNCALSPRSGALSSIRPLRGLSSSLSEHATPGGFRWTVIRDAAEGVVSERGVLIGDVRAATRVIEVDGLWSYLIAPGCGICSTSVAASPDHAARYLRDVFSAPLSASGAGSPRA